MPIIKDAKQQEWELLLTVRSERDLRNNLDVSLTRVFDDGFESIKKILDDSVVFVEVLFTVMKKQADERKIEVDDFAELFYGEVLEEAAEAFVKALVNFYPKQQGEILQKAIQEAKEMERVLREHRGSLTAEMDGIGVSEAKRLIAAHTKLREKSESTPSTSPSESSTGCPEEASALNGGTPRPLSVST